MRASGYDVFFNGISWEEMKMYRNATGQYVCFAMLSATDWSAVTGLSPSVWVTKDGGSQTAGAGTVSELGNGQYRYLFTQAETNANAVMFVAKGTGAVAVALTVYTEDASVVRAANVTQIDGQATNGNNATLNLKQLNVVNSAGSAVIASSTGGNGTGLAVSGHGTGSAMSLSGGTNALLISGATRSVYINHSGTGPGVMVTNTTPGVNAIEIAHIPSSSGSGSAFRVVNGANATGTTISLAHAGTAGTTVQVAGGGSGAGMTLTGGTTGVGLLVSGGSTSGNAVTITSAVNGIGVAIMAGAANAGVQISGGATGPAVKLVGGGTSGTGLSISTTNGDGVSIASAGTGKFDINADNWCGVDVATVVGAIKTVVDAIGVDVDALGVSVDAIGADVDALGVSVDAIGVNAEEIEGILAGPGTSPVALVVREPDGGALIADAEVWLTVSGESSTPVVARGRTDVMGEVSFLLELGETYYLWASRVGMKPIMGEAFVAS